jgi:copper(I)-binding protein
MATWRCKIVTLLELQLTMLQALQHYKIMTLLELQLVTLQAFQARDAWARIIATRNNAVACVATIRNNVVR